jgi:hypothetical protein
MTDRASSAASRNRSYFSVIIGVWEVPGAAALLVPAGFAAIALASWALRPPARRDLAPGPRTSAPVRRWTACPPRSCGAILAGSAVGGRP